MEDAHASLESGHTHSGSPSSLPPRAPGLSPLFLHLQFLSLSVHGFLSTLKQVQVSNINPSPPLILPLLQTSTSSFRGNISNPPIYASNQPCFIFSPNIEHKCCHQDHHWLLPTFSECFVYLYFLFVLLGPYVWHKEVPRLGVSSEL